jgi:two-component system, NarL family, response regulator
MKNKKRIRALVVDSSPVFRIGLIEALRSETDIVVVSEAGTGPEAVASYRRLRPDVAILDLHLPQMSGVQTIAAICHEIRSARIVVLTDYDGHEDIYRALQAGASAYLVKTVAPDELIRAIRQVHSGQRYLPADIAVRLVQRQGSPDLSPRESDILQLIAKGRSNKEMAASLHIAEVTVKVHVRHLLRKLQVADRTQAVVAAIERGIVHLN